MVWTTGRSGFETLQTSLTPSAQICGFRPWRPKWSIAAAVRWPGVPSASTVILARARRARLEVRQRLAVLAAPLSPGADADDAGAIDEELVRRGLGEDRRAGRFSLLGEAAAELGDGDDLVPVVLHRRRRRDAMGGDFVRK